MPFHQCPRHLYDLKPEPPLLPPPLLLLLALLALLALVVVVVLLVPGAPVSPPGAPVSPPGAPVSPPPGVVSSWGAVCWTVAAAGDCGAAMAAVAPAEMRNALLTQEAQMKRGSRPRAVVVIMTP